MLNQTLLVGRMVSKPELKQTEAGKNYASITIAVPKPYTNENGVYLLNPGSISLPKENHPRTYAILDDSNFTIYEIDHTPYMSIEIE